MPAVDPHVQHPLSAGSSLLGSDVDADRLSARHRCTLGDARVAHQGATRSSRDRPGRIMAALGPLRTQLSANTSPPPIWKSYVLVVWLWALFIRCLQDHFIRCSTTALTSMEGQCQRYPTMSPSREGVAVATARQHCCPRMNCYLQSLIAPHA